MHQQTHKVSSIDVERLAEIAAVLGVMIPLILSYLSKI